MAVKLAGALILVAWAAVSAVRLQDWRANQTLWERAVAVNPSLPRPLVNLAVQRRASHDYEGAVSLLVKAGGLAGTSPHPEAILQSVRAQMQWIQAFGGDVCGRPDVQPYCY